MADQQKTGPINPRGMGFNPGQDLYNIAQKYRGVEGDNTGGGGWGADEPTNDWTVKEAFKDAASTFASVIGNLAGFSGTVVQWLDADGDTDPNDWQSIGAGVFKTAQEVMLAASESLESKRIKVSGDEVFEGLKNGNIIPSLLFVRDQFPNAAAYLISSIPGMGLPLLASETERTLEERMKNQGLENKDASPLDVAAAGVSAIVNVAAERLFKAKPVGDTLGKVITNAVKKDLAWEAAGGSLEEALTKIGTDADFTLLDLGKQAFLEALGGLGVTPVTAVGQVRTFNNMQAVKMQLENRKAEIISGLEQQLESATSKPEKRKIRREIEKVGKATTLAKLNLAYPPEQVDTEDTPVGEESATPTAEQEAPTTTPEQEAAVPTPEQEASRTIAERADAGLDAETAGQAGEETDVDAQSSMPEILPRRDQEPGTFAGPQPVEGEYDMPTAPPVQEPLMPRMSGILESFRRNRAAKRARLEAARSLEMPTKGGEARAQERARSAAATEEDIAMTLAARADEGQRSEEPLVESELGPSTLTHKDVAIGGNAVQRARRRIQGIPEDNVDLPQRILDAQEARKRATRRAQGIPEVNRSPTVADLNAFEKERLARIEEARQAERDAQADERKAAAERAREQAELDKRQAERDAVALEDAIADAENQADDFILPFYNQRGKVTIGSIKNIAAPIANEINRTSGPKARKAFTNRLNENIDNLKAEWAEDAMNEASEAAAKPKEEAGPKAKPEPEAEPQAEPEAGAQAGAQAGASTKTGKRKEGTKGKAEAKTAKEKPTTGKPTQADATPPTQEGETEPAQPITRKETFTTTYGLEMDREYTVSNDDMGMSKSEFDRFNTKENGVVPDYFIEVMAEKRLAGDEFNQWEKAAITWPGVAEQIAQAERRRAEEAEADTLRNPESLVPSASNAELARRAAKRKETPKKTEPTSRQKKRKPIWKEKNGSWTANLNGYPVRIDSTDADTVYKVTYQGETYEFTAPNSDVIKSDVTHRFGSEEQKAKAGEALKEGRVAKLKEELRQIEAVRQIEAKAIEDVKQGKPTEKIYEALKAKATALPPVPNSESLLAVAEAYRKQAHNYKNNNKKILNTGVSRKAEIQAELEELANKGKKTTKPKAETKKPAGRRRKYFPEEAELPKVPGKMGLIKNLVEPLEKDKPYQTYVDGQPYKASRSIPGAIRLLNNATEQDLADIYQKRIDEENAEKARKNRETELASNRRAGVESRAANAIGKADARKQKILDAAEKIDLRSLSLRMKQTLPSKDEGDVNKIVPSVKKDYHLSTELASAGYDVVVRYKNKPIEIVPFSLVDINDANKIRETVQQQPALFYEFINEQVDKGNMELVPVDVKDTGDKQIKAQQRIDTIKQNSVKKKKPLTDEQKAEIEDLKKQIDNLRKKPETVYAAIPKQEEKALNDWLDLMEDRGVLSRADLARSELGEPRTEELGADTNAEDLKKKEIVKSLAEEVDVVGDIKSLSDQFLDDYTVMIDLWESGEQDTVLLTLNNTKKNGGMSLGDLKKLAESIESQESSFQLYPDKYFKSKEGVDFRDKKKKPSKSTYVLAITEWLNSDRVVDTSYIEDASEFIVTAEDLGWGPNNIKESRSATPEKGFESPVLASNALISEMHDIWGKKATDRMIDIGFINLLTYDQVRSSSQRYKNIKKETNAFVDAQDGKIVFIIDNIANNTNDVRGLIMHELGVHYGKNILSDREFHQVLDQIFKLHRSGDEVVVAAVNAVIDNYYAKGTPLSKLRMGAPARKIRTEGEWARHEDNASFWEEVLAHVIQFKAADIKPSLWNKITKAFNRFFAKILKPFDAKADPEVSVEDIVSLIQYSVGRVPSHAMKTYDGALKDRLAIIRRDKFLKDSKVKDLLYHGSLVDFTAPVLEKTELGMHVGTLQSATQRLESIAEKRKTFDIARNENDILYSGYANIKNPLELPDVSAWTMPIAWKNAIKDLDLLFHDGLDGPLGEEILNIVNEFTGTDKVLKIYGKDKETARQTFASKIRKAILDAGYDSIKYTNLKEDILSTSYILLNEGQFKSEQAILYDDKAPSIFESRGRRIIGGVIENTQNAERGRSLLNSSFKAIQKYIEPLMTINEYKVLEEARMKMKGEKEKYANLGRVMYDVLRNARTPSEKRALERFFETRDASPDRLPNRRISYAPFESVLKGTRPGPKNEAKMTIREAAVQSKRYIEELGEQLVQAGVLDRDQFEGLRGKYLPRVYLEFVQKGQDRIGAGYMTGTMNYTRARRDEESFIQDLISGRIKDPAYLASRYITMAGTDLATLHMLNFIASAPAEYEWTIPNEIMSIDGVTGSTFYFKELATAMRGRASTLRSQGQTQDATRAEAFASRIDREIASRPEIANIDTKKFKRVPNSVRYGAMRGLPINKIIWNDIVQQGVLTSQNEVLNGVLRFASKVQKTFKYTHVPMQIPAQSRNAISNMTLLWSSGVPIHKTPGLISKALENIINNGKYMQIARKYGIETTTFSTEELGSIDKQLAQLQKDQGGMIGTFAQIKLAMDQFNVFGRLYQKTEVLFKIAKLIDGMERKGLSEVEAAMKANEALLDYGNVSPLLRTLRTMPLGSPFITFNAKVLTQLMRNVKENPMANIKLMAIPYVLANIILDDMGDLDDDDLEALKKWVPEYAENNMHVFFLPYKDENGKWTAYDASYFLPWGAHYSISKDIANAELGEAWKTVGVLGGPVQGLIAGMQNIDPFTGKEIWNESDPPNQQAQDIMLFMASYMIPPMLLPRNKSGGTPAGGGPLFKSMMAMDLIEGNIGKDGLPKYSGMDALLSWFGINAIKVGDYEMRNKLYWKQKDIELILKRAESRLKDPSLSRESREKLLEEYRLFATQKYLELQRWAEEARKIYN